MVVGRFHEDFCLQHREECGCALEMWEVKGNTPVTTGLKFWGLLQTETQIEIESQKQFTV